MASRAFAAAGILCGLLAAGPAAAQAPACRTAADPASFTACVRAALRSADPDTRGAGLMAFLERLKVATVEFEAPADLVAFRARVATGSARDNEMPPTIYLQRRFMDDTGGRIALRLAPGKDDGTVVLTPQDRQFRGTNVRSDVERENHGVAQATGDVFRARKDENENSYIIVSKI